MSEILLTAFVGIIVGIIDILPMLKMKLDKYAISSAFTFYFLMPFIIFNVELLNNLWWLKGGFLALILSIPTLILISKADKKGVIPISIMAIILGSCIGVIGHFFGIM